MTGTGEHAVAQRREGAGAEDSALSQGLALYRSGAFWEAHEAWEPVWLSLPPNSRERALLQGLIQIANGRLKLGAGRAKAAARISDMAAEHLAAAGSATVPGLAPGWAGRELAGLQAAIREVDDSAL